MTKGRISEIFESMQGEGICVGQRQVFVRFFGCNLACRYCDTPQEHFREYAHDELLHAIEACSQGTQCISFTGGEPLLQNDFLRGMMQLTFRKGYKNYLETNGILYRELAEVIDFVHMVAMDIKLPSSTDMVGVWDAHREFLKIASRKETFVKIVICTQTTEDDMRTAAALIKDTSPATTVVLQPNSLEDEQLVLARNEVARGIFQEHGLVVCCIPQVHKTVGVP